MRISLVLAGGVLTMTFGTVAHAQTPPSAAVRAETAATGPVALKPFNAAEVIADVRKIYNERYVLPEMRPKIDAKLKAGLDSGRYRTGDPALLAERVNADLREVANDGHLNIRYNPAGVTANMRAGATPGDRAALERRDRDRNYGFAEMKVLPGNIRYLAIPSFGWGGPDAAAAIDSAMAFLAQGDAVIIDLRKNGGGQGPAVTQAISQFVAPETPLISFRRGDEQSPLITSRPGLSKMVGKPLYVLTSGETASAGEEFAGHVAGYRLGEIVGDATAGAAFMNSIHGLDSGFEVSVSEARPVLASTGGDWERVGIAPTIKVDPMIALEVAQAHALRKLAKSAPAEIGKSFEEMAAGYDMLARPRVAVSDPDRYVGSYGDRVVSFDGTSLWIRQDRRMPRKLVALGGDRFTFEESPGIQARFEVKANRAVAIELGQPGGPMQSKVERSGG